MEEKKEWLLRNENYYQVQGWMIRELHLKGVALNAYAIIYGFSQSGENEYTTSLKYMCEFCGNVTKTTLINALNELLERDLITKRQYIEDGKMRTAYCAKLYPVQKLDIVQKLDTGLKIKPQESKNYTDTGIEIRPYNKNNNKIINNNIYIYIIYYLNSITKNNYDVNHSKNKELILELLSKGYTQDDLTAVVDTMNAIWKGTDKAQYLRPTTLFDPEKFPKYLERSRIRAKPATPFYPNPLPQPPTPAKCISSPHTKGGKRQPNFDVDDFFAKALARSDAELAKYGKNE